MAEAAFAATVKFIAAAAAKVTVKAVVTAAAKVALLAGVNAVVQNNSKPEQQGGLTTLTINPAEPRRLQVGKRLNGGVLVDWYVRGSKNQNLYLVIYLGEGPMGQLTRVFAGGREVYSSTIAHGVRTTIPDFRSGGDRLWVTYYDGRPGQTADSNLVSQGLGWTSACVGTGCAYAIVEMQWDSDNLTSPPSLAFELEGAKLYDRRKDTTAGGSGSHRADDPSTWELSSNPAVALDHYLLGRYIGSVKAFGIGLDEDDVPYDRFAALANLCDEDVTLKAGGTQNRYEAHGFLFADRSYSDTIKDLCRAMNARPADFGGRVGILDGQSRTPVMTLTDDDVIEDATEQYTPKRSWNDLVSEVRGTYQDPRQNYQAIDYPRITDSAWVTADGGSAKEATLDLEMETDPERAQRLAWLYAMRERRQAQLTGTYKLRAIELEQGDWFIRDSAKFGEDGKVFEVIDRVLDVNSMTVTLTAFEVDAADTAWSTDIPADAPAAPVSNEDTLQDMEVPGLTVTGVTLTGTAAQLPAIKAEWTAPTDPRVRQIIVEAVPQAGGTPTSVAVDAATEEVVIGAGVTDDTDYYVRARFVGTFAPSDWTSTYSVTTEGDYSVGVATSVPWSGVTDDGGRPEDNADVTATSSAHLAVVSEITAARDGEASLNAKISSVETAYASADSAIASDVSTLEAAYEKTAKQLVVDNFNNDGFYWTTAFGGAPDSVADPANFSYTDVSGIGRVAQTSTFPCYLTPKAAIKPYAGMKLRLEVKVRATADPSSGAISATLVATSNGLSSAWVHGAPSASRTVPSGYSYQEVGLTVADGWVTIAAYMTCTGISTYDAGWRPRLDITHSGSGGTVQIAYFRIEDVTEGQTYTNAQVTSEATARASADSAIAADVTALEARMDTAETDIGTIETAAAALDARVVTVESDYATATSLSALSATVTTLSGDLDTAEANISTNAAAITSEASTRASADSAAATRLDALEATVDTPTTGLSAVVSGHTTAIADLDSTKAEASDLSTLSSTVSTISTDLTAAEGDISALQTDLTAAEADIVTNAAAITSEASTRASADSAIASDLTTLEASYEKTTKQLLVKDFNNDGFYWTTGFTGAPDAIADPTGTTYTDVSNVGRVAEFSTFAKYFHQKAAIRPYVGMKLRIEAKIRATADPSSGAITATINLTGLNADFSAFGSGSVSFSTPDGYNYTESGLTISDGWVTIARYLTCTAISTYDANWRPRVGFTHSGSGGTCQIAYMKIEDVTESQAYTNAQVTSEASARASADSAIASDVTTLTSTVSTLSSDLDTAEATIATNTASITSEASTRASADSAIASDVTTLEVSVETNRADYDATTWDDISEIWTWDAGSVEGWSASNATLSAHANGGLLVTQSGAGTDIHIRSPASLTIDGSRYYKIVADVECVTLGSSGAHDGTLYYTTSGHGESGSYRDVPRINTAFTEGERRLLIYDMDDPFAGGTDWVSNTITRVRMDLPQRSGSVWLVRSFKIVGVGTQRSQATVKVTAEAVAEIEGNLSAAYGVTVDVNGRIAALKLLSDGTSATAALLGDLIYFGDNTVFEDTYNTFYTTYSSYRLRSMGPFGSSSDLLLWYGPTSVSLNSETKTNGVMALATDGKLYVGSDPANALSGVTLDSYFQLGFTSAGTGYSDTVTATAIGGDGTYTYLWTRTGESGPTRTTCSNTGIQTPTFSVAAGGTSADTWACTVTETSTGRSYQASVKFDVSLI